MTLIENDPGTQAFAWVPQVDEEHRALYEGMASVIYEQADLVFLTVDGQLAPAVWLRCLSWRLWRSQECAKANFNYHSDLRADQRNVITNSNFKEKQSDGVQT